MNATKLLRKKQGFLPLNSFIKLKTIEHPYLLNNPKRNCIFKESIGYFNNLNNDPTKFNGRDELETDKGFNLAEEYASTMLPFEWYTIKQFDEKNKEFKFGKIGGIIKYSDDSPDFYKVILEDGKFISVTQHQQFLTLHGWKELFEIANKCLLVDDEKNGLVFRKIKKIQFEGKMPSCQLFLDHFTEKNRNFIANDFIVKDWIEYV